MKDKAPYGFIKIIDDTDELLHEALKNGDTLATPKESQMLINMTGVSINTRPRSDGRFQGYIARTDGTKQYFYGKSREEVATKIKSFLQEAKTPKRKNTKKITPTFGEFYRQWFDFYKKPNLKPKSVLAITSSLKSAVACFENKAIDKIDTNDMQTLLLSISAPRVREMCKSNLNQIFTKAYKQGVIKKNPCEALELKAYKYTHKKALTVTEQQKVLSAAESTKYSLLYRFLIATGLRIGEALALTKSDVDFNNCTVSINKNVVFINGERIVQDTPKTDAGNRTIPVSSELCIELAKINTAILFPFTYGAVYHSFREITQKTGIKVTAHLLRHTYATRLEEAGIPPKIKQYLMGHATLHMTQDIYTDAQEEYVKSLSNKIRGLF